MIFYEHDPDGWLVGWYDAVLPRPNSTPEPPPPSTNRRVNGMWVYDPSRETAAAKVALMDRIYAAYEEAERANLTPAGAIQLAEWCAAGRPKALAVRAWVAALYSERDAKLAAVEAGDLMVDPAPSEPRKPHAFREIAADPS